MKRFRRHLIVGLLVIVLLLSGKANAGQPAKLTVQSVPPGATVMLDGRELKLKTPLRINVSPGVHSIRLVKDGYRGVSREVEIYSGTGFASFTLESSRQAPAPSRLNTSKASRFSTPENTTKQAANSPEPSLAGKSSLAKKGSESTVEQSGDELVFFSGPVKVVHRSQKDAGSRQAAKKENNSWNLLPDDNPFSKWLSSRDKKETGQTAGENQEADKSNLEEEERIKMAHLRASRDGIFPLLIKEDPSLQDREKAGKDKDQFDAKPEPEKTQGAKAKLEQEGSNELVPGSLEGGSVMAESALMPAPKLKWPDSAEDLMYQAATDLPRFPEKFNILLLGLDRRDRRGILATGAEIPVEKLRKKRANSDVILVAQLDFIDKSIRVVSVPRDTRVKIPGRRGHRKVNSAYAYGREKKSKQVLEKFLGIPIHRTIVADWRSAKKCISIFKSLGLDYNGFSEKEMFWHLRKRSFRRGDFRRIERQQQFLRYGLGEGLRLYNETRAARGTVGAVKKGVLDMAIKQGLNVVETDLSYEEALLLAYAFREYDMREITMAQVRGRGRLVGKTDDSGGVYFFFPTSHHSFEDIIAKAESG